MPVLQKKLTPDAQGAVDRRLAEDDERERTRSSRFDGGCGL